METKGERQNERGGGTFCFSSSDAILAAVISQKSEIETKKKGEKGTVGRK